MVKSFLNLYTKDSHFYKQINISFMLLNEQIINKIQCISMPIRNSLLLYDDGLSDKEIPILWRGGKLS